MANKYFLDLDGTKALINKIVTLCEQSLTTESDPIFTASAAYGISAGDITNWNSKTSNVGTITGITMNGSSKGTSGVVDLGTVLTTESDPVFLASAAAGITSSNISAWSGKQDALVSGTNIKTINNESILGSGNITIAAASAETDPIFSASPAAGITATDITNWNAKLDSFTETDPLFTASAAAGITSGNITNWNSAVTNSHTHSNKSILDDISSSDITNWNSKTDNVGTITGVTMNNTSMGTSGVVDLGTVITSETQLSKGATSGNGNAVTDISVSGHEITFTKGSTFITSSDLTSYADGAEYDSTNHLIYLKHGNTRLSNPINAADFIKDGMVSTVTVGTPATGINAGVMCLIVTFNTDAGTSPIELPISQIFNANNYYTKTEIDNAGYLTSHQSIKTINNNTITGTGNVTINELPTVTSSDNGKVLVVVNGAWTLVTPAQIYSGSGVPNNAQGNNGDIYLQI